MARMIIFDLGVWPELQELRYDPQNFRDLYESELGSSIWDFMRRPDSLVRMETATYLGRSAVEPLGPYLVYEYGSEIEDDRIKQMIGHMARQIMEALDFELERKGMRITRGGLFTTGAKYADRNDPRGTSMKVTSEQRRAWLEKTAHGPFNIWIDKQIRDAHGKLDIEKLYALAAKYGIEKRYPNLNPGQIRMNLGNALRRRVPEKEYGG